MTVKTEGQHAGEFLISEANGKRSRDAIIINAGAGVLSAGTLVAQITAANAASATAGSNTGNGAIGAIGVDNAAITGDYIVTITEAAADGGAFSVVDPNGVTVGSGTVGVEFAGGGLTFTIADGTTDFAVNDSWTIAVNAGIGEWVAYDNDGTNDGRRACGGVLFAGVDATHADARAVGIVRDAEVRGSDLVGLDTDGAADLKAIGVIVR
jgi:hypothetical protein